MITSLKNKVLNGGQISKEDALELLNVPLDELCNAADEIRRKYCGNSFDLCSIINAKSGKCSENCRYCAQSAHYNTVCKEYPLISAQTACLQAEINAAAGILRFSLVTSGKRLNDSELEDCCCIIRAIKSKTDISVCGSFGLLSKEQYVKLKDAGLTRVHNNLEACREFFPNICTSHGFDDKLEAINAARAAGLSVCSGGIMGLGESEADRIELAFTLRELGVLSIPLNMLNPIKGTPLENNTVLTESEMQRICAIFRFINPKAAIRLAGGRGLMKDKGAACFSSGANAAITNNMLTTSGIGISDDLEILKKLGFEAKLIKN